MILRTLRILIFALALALGAQPSSAQDRIEGEWNVSYYDLELGMIVGKAHVEGERATLELTSIRFGETYALTARNIAFHGNSVTMVLEGLSPLPEHLSDGLDDPAWPLVVDPGGGTLVVTRGENRVEHRVDPRGETDMDRVNLELTLADDGQSMSGRWFYRADRYLGTDERGLGRHGFVSEQDGVYFAEGIESWSRPKVQVYGAVVLQDQLGLEVFADGTTTAHYGYPWSGGNDADKVQRWIFVYGRDIPADYRRSLSIETIDPGIAYSEKHRETDSERSGDAAALFAEGWERARNQLRAAGYDDAEIDGHFAGLTAIILRADISRDAVPGYNSFEIDGSEAAWPLQFGDNVGSLRFVRRTGENDHDFERVHYAFAGERVMVELRTRFVLPVDSVPVVVGLNGAPALAGDATSTGIPAFRSPDDPRLYRTELIQIDSWIGPGAVAPAGGDRLWHRVGAGHGDRLTALVAQPGLLSVAPDFAQATVFATPTDTAVGGDWQGFLSTAAGCVGIDLASTTGADTAGAGSIDELLIDSGSVSVPLPGIVLARLPIPGWMRTKISVGQHAAMLMLRDTYVRLMLRSEAQLRRIQSDQEITLYRRSIENLVRQGLHPLARISVMGIDGLETEFHWTFEADIVAQVTGQSRDAVDAWAIAATREALGKQIALMQAATAKAQAIDVCDLEPLLRLTGYGFGPIAEIAASKLMRRGPSPQFWIPDARPRAFIETVAYVASDLAIQDRMVSEDREAALQAVGLASVPVAIGGGLVGSGAAAVAVALVDIGDIGWGAHTVLAEKWRTDDEVRLALASASILGMDRLQAAEAAHQTWTHVIFNRLVSRVGLAAAGLGLDLPQLSVVLRESISIRRIARGQAVLQSVDATGESAAAAAERAAANDNALVRVLQDSASEPSPAAASDVQPVNPTIDAPPLHLPNPDDGPPLRLNFDALPDLSPQSADDLFAALDNLTPDEARQLSELADIDGFVSGRATPDWAVHFDPADLDRIRPLLFREDLQQLLDESAAEIAASLRSTDPVRRAYAWQLVQYEPELTLEAFNNRLDKLVKEAPRDRGPDYFAQTAANDNQVNEALARAKWSFGPSQFGGYVIRDPDGNFGSIKRSYEPTTQVATLTYAFRKDEDSPGRIAGMIEGIARVPTVGNRIVSMDFFGMRVFHQNGVRYGAAAGEEGAITRVMMEHIANPLTLATVNWWKRTHFPTTNWENIPVDEVGAMLMATHSVEYARRTLASMGYRVTAARMFSDAATRNDYALAYYRGFFDESDESWEHFLARHGIDPTERSSIASFNIDLDVVPW